MDHVSFEKHNKYLLDMTTDLPSNSYLFVGSQRDPEAFDEVPKVRQELAVLFEYKFQLHQNILNDFEIFFNQLFVIFTLFCWNVQIGYDQVDALNEPLNCNLEVLLALNDPLLNIKFICHFAYLIKFVEILPRFIAYFNIS
jgi:hypothetical protein